MNDIYYFAYGMNTNIDGMAGRCPGAESLGHAVLEDYRFRFAVHADVVKCKASKVDGVLWRISTNHLVSLDGLEGYPYYYDRAEVDVVYQGKTIKAITYFMQPGNSVKEPGDGYLNNVLEGYARNNVPTEQVHRALSVAKKQHYFVA